MRRAARVAAMPRYNGRMANDRRRFWTTVLTALLLPTAVIALLLTLALPGPRTQSGGSAGGGSSNGNPISNILPSLNGSGPAGVRANAPIFAASDGRHVWVVHPFELADKENPSNQPQPVYELLRRAGNTGIWTRRDLSATPASPMVMAITAAIVQTASQPPALGWRAASRAAASATTPISMPPLPGTAVNDPARSSVCRMYFRLSMACSCSSTGCVRGVAITLDDSAGRPAFQVLFEIKSVGRAAGQLQAANDSCKPQIMREISDSLDDPDKMLA